MFRSPHNFSLENPDFFRKNKRKSLEKNLKWLPPKKKENRKKKQKTFENKKKHGKKCSLKHPTPKKRVQHFWERLFHHNPLSPALIHAVFHLFQRCHATLTWQKKNSWQHRKLWNLLQQVVKSSRKLTYQWNIPIFSRKYIGSIRGPHFPASYVRLLKCTWHV